MSISVHCEECGKTYQLRDEMAGRRGKCPNGHKIIVPALTESPAEVVNEFTFTNDPATLELADPRPAKKVGKKAASRTAEQAAPAPDKDDNEFAFPRAGAITVRDEEPAPKSSRYRNSGRAAKEKAAGKSMMPMLVGGVVAILGIGGGLGLFFVARAEVNPLREQAEAANKKAADAELRAKTAEAGKVAAETELPELKKTLAARDTELKTAKEEASTAKKKAAKLEQERKDAEAAKPAMGDVNAAGAKKDPADAKGDMPVKMPAGGKNWLSPATVTFGNVNVKAGDRLLVTPKEDAVLKAAAGKFTFKFRFEVMKGKELPADVFSTIMIVQAGAVKTFTIPVKLAGPTGEAESTIDSKGITDGANITFYISDGNLKDPELKNIKVFSNLVSMQAEFGPGKK